MKRNPKQEGSNMLDCRPQTGSCPMDCNQCFYNRPGAFYVDINQPNIPDPEEVGDKIVRMNCGHDSNLQRDLVIETAKRYKHYFFNTSIPKFDFPGPVVFTANPKEEKMGWFLPACETKPPGNLMFVRLRVSSSNLKLIDKQVLRWTRTLRVPVVLTFMAYYDQDPPDAKSSYGGLSGFGVDSKHYKWKTRHINSYYCPTREFKEYALKRMKRIGGRLVTLCGTLDSNYCRDCLNCQMYYYQTIKHMKEVDGGIFNSN